jgi:hypothetical protein
MNNLTFGDDTFGYYETICGGSGATKDADGADAVHTHMTNTRLTDPEVIERRYPVRVLEFSICRGSGGRRSNPGNSDDSTSSPLRKGGLGGSVNRDAAIDREIVFTGIVQAILEAARKHFGEEVLLEVRIDRNTGEPTLFEEGHAIDPVLLGEILGRIAAQSAKRGMIQKIRDSERQDSALAPASIERRGGDGVIRRLEFLRPLRVSILSERRGRFAPFGLHSGPAGAIGQNTLQRAGSDRVEVLGGKVQIEVAPGDVLTIATPGGGAYVVPSSGGSEFGTS